MLPVQTISREGRGEWEVDAPRKNRAMREASSAHKPSVDTYADLFTRARGGSCHALAGTAPLVSFSI